MHEKEGQYGGEKTMPQNRSLGNTRRLVPSCLETELLYLGKEVEGSLPCVQKLEAAQVKERLDVCIDFFFYLLKAHGFVNRAYHFQFAQG